ncbi:MAG: arsenate reductase ArsC [Planctomycetota bacterium]|jgi:protein-tyrosine-phosphatase
MADNRSLVLFLCTENSARSILAEAICNQKFGDRLEAFSAGVAPKGEVHPLALETIQANGLATEGLQPKSWDEMTDRLFDLVVTLCDDARGKPCPGIMGQAPQEHWILPDPPAAEHPQGMFEAVYDALLEAIGLLAYGPDPSLTGRAAEASRQLSRRLIGDHAWPAPPRRALAAI